MAVRSPCARDRRALDGLIGAAFVDEDIRHQVLHERKDAWLAGYALSGETRRWLQQTPAKTLQELAQAILACT